MNDSPFLRRVAAEDFDALITTLADLKAASFALLGPGFESSLAEGRWLVEDEDQMRVFQLKVYISDLADRLLPLVNVQRLLLCGLRLDASSVGTILRCFPRLTHLHLGSNYVKDNGAYNIATSAPQLLSLNLAGNQIGDDGATAIAAHMFQLRSLCLADNHVGIAGAKAIATSLKNLGSLDLDGNRVRDDGAKAIASRLLRLSELHLGYNHISPDGIKAIASSLAGIRSLYLPGNNIGPDGLRQIATGLPLLYSLDLSFTQVDGASPLNRPSGLGQLANLALAGNNVTDPGAAGLVTALPSLLTLDLHANQIHHEGAVAIATNLQRLSSLSLASNPIGDEGVKAIARLSDLTALNLRKTLVTDLGVEAIALGLPELRSLDLRRNSVGDAGAVVISRNLTKLRRLNLGGNHIADQGASAIAAGLTGLTSLDLGDNLVGTEGAAAIATHLTQLVSLDLWENRIRAEGAVIIASKLSKLKSLNLWGNQIGSEGATAIAANLGQLTSLSLGDNRLGPQDAETLAEHLTNLLHLDLRDNAIGDQGAKAIAKHLATLTSINLSGVGLGDEGAKAIAASLHQLSSLTLGGNDVGDSGAKAVAEHMPKLAVLHLWDNHVSDQGADAIAKGLELLTELDLAGNQVGNCGATAVATNLPRLQRLSLARNTQVTSVDPMARLVFLKFLDVSLTNITDLSPMKTLIESGIPLRWEPFGPAIGINAYGCPLAQPTAKMIREGDAAVLNYFRELDRQGVDYLYEAKVLLVGEGGAGKTSLLRRLYYPDLPLPAEDESTRGIDIHTTQFRRNDGGPFRVNVWDFGGQHIYHATHQFFLTKNSLYVLVDDTRKDHKSARDEGFKYWLEVVEAFGAGSPILIFQNEKGGRTKKIDEAGIRSRYPNVLETIGGDLARRDAVDRLKRSMEFHVQKLPHVGEAVPAKWVSIRTAIEDTAKEKPYLTQSQYFELYGRHLEMDEDKALHLSKYLHDLGVFLHFQDDYRLRRTIIIRNSWATEAVFKILDDETVKGQFGRFSLEDCRRLWKSSEYSDMHLELVALMEKFELCYRLDDKKPEMWLVPQLLCPSMPSYAHNWAQPGDLVLTYRYDFLPRGVVSRLVVRMHRYVNHPDTCWTNGALFQQSGNSILVQVAEKGDEITLRARGPEARILLSVISAALDALNDGFPGLEGKVAKLVPCICERCSRSTTPILYEQKRLLQRRRDGRLKVECPESYENVDVLELLDGLRLPQLAEEVLWKGRLAGPQSSSGAVSAETYGSARTVHQLRNGGSPSPVSVAIITIRGDERDAILNRLERVESVHGSRKYNVGLVGTKRVAVLRLPEAGNGPAQDATRDIIDDFAPRLICLVGIGGGVPAWEFTLGDVMLATRIADLRMMALRPDQAPQFEIRGERVSKAVADFVANLRREDLPGPWFRGLGPHPEVPLDPDRFEGPETWRRKVLESLRRHFIDSSRNREPLFFTGTVAASDSLVRDPVMVGAWLEGQRKIETFEMEAAGVLESAARADRSYPVIVVRGLSDIVGYRRNPDWTSYAANAAAAFTVAMIASGLTDAFLP